MILCFALIQAIIIVIIMNFDKGYNIKGAYPPERQKKQDWSITFSDND